MEKLKVNMGAAGRRVFRCTAFGVLLLSLLITMSPEESFAAEKASARPVIKKAVICKNNQAKLQWNRVKNAVKYQVYRKKEGGRFVLVKTTKKKSYQSRSLGYGTRYIYKVKAVSRNGSSRMSKEKVISTKPAKPVIVVTVSDGNHTRVSWRKVKGALQYKVYRKKGDGRFVLVKTTDRTTYLSGKLAYGARYAYKVKVVSKDGKVNTSETYTVTTGMQPALPGPSVAPDASITPEIPSLSDKPAIIPVPESSDRPSAPEVPQQTPALDVPIDRGTAADRTVTVKVPVYEMDIVYWIKDVRTGEVLYQTTDAAAMETEILTRPDPETWHWGSGGVRLITGYEVFTMTETEWKESWYYQQPDVIAEYHT